MRCERIVTLLAVILALLWAGCDSNGGGGSNGGRFINGGGNTATYLLYTDATANTLNVASIGTTGALNTVTAPGQTGVLPIAMATTPDGKFVYVLNANAGTVSQFAVAADGTLSQPATAIGTGLQPTAIAVDPQGRFVAVANSNAGATGTLSIFTINTTTGALASLANPVSLTIDDPKAITISGNSIYVAGTNVIDAFAFTPQTFSFTLQGGWSNVGSQTEIVGLYSPPQASNVLYALDSGTDMLLSFNLDNSGFLNPTGSVATGSDPAALVADSQNRFLFVANKGSNDISVFTVNATTGALTAASTTALAAGSAPNTLAYDPVNNFLLVGLSGSRQIIALAVNTSTGGLSTLAGPMTVTNAASALAVAKP